MENTAIRSRWLSCNRSRISCSKPTHFLFPLLLVCPCKYFDFLQCLVFCFVHCSSVDENPPHFVPPLKAFSFNGPVYIGAQSFYCHQSARNEKSANHLRFQPTHQIQIAAFYAQLLPNQLFHFLIYPKWVKFFIFWMRYFLNGFCLSKCLLIETSVFEDFDLQSFINSRGFSVSSRKTGKIGLFWWYIIFWYCTSSKRKLM